ncbi:hypothetical protein HPP92_018083 [Vanilla planifolia]|uniref:Uncharacterized protein n=1 Tax=Vanilla planifolia TaxID=51239 RepID=A0A835Q953_VANPL|nr:hypothetical protein HPP92_018083 [Vanilla planifolia]
MDERGVKKEAGWSLIEWNGTVLNIKVGGFRNPVSDHYERCLQLICIKASLCLKLREISHQLPLHGKTEVSPLAMVNAANSFLQHLCRDSESDSDPGPFFGSNSCFNRTGVELFASSERHKCGMRVGDVSFLVGFMKDKVTSIRVTKAFNQAKRAKGLKTLVLDQSVIFGQGRRRRSHDESLFKGK